MREIIYKIPEGKLLKLFLETENDKIVDIKITGDFFVYPEEKIVKIEGALKGQVLDKEALRKAIQGVVDKESMELFGINAEGIVTAIFL